MHDFDKFRAKTNNSGLYAEYIQAVGRPAINVSRSHFHCVQPVKKAYYPEAYIHSVLMLGILRHTAI